MGVAMGASGAPEDTQIKGPQVSSRILSSYGKAEELAFANGNNTLPEQGLMHTEQESD